MKVTKNIVIIADDIDGEALAMLVVNKMRGNFNILAVKAPAFGDRRKAILQDIAILTGERSFLKTRPQTRLVTIEDWVEPIVFGPTRTTLRSSVVREIKLLLKTV